MRRIILAVPLFAACHRPDPAPTTLDDLCSFMYTHAQDSDPTSLAEGVDNMAAWIAANPDAISADGYQVNNLDEATLSSLDGRTRTNVGLVGGTTDTHSPYAVKDLAPALVTADQTQVYPSVYDSFDRTFATDGQCFVDQTCDNVQFDNDSVAHLPLGITVDTVTTGQFRWVDTNEGKVLVTRAWLHDPAVINVDFFKVNAQYFLTVTFDDPDAGATRLQATWADAQIIGIDVPDGTALRMLINSFQKNDQMLYDYVAAQNGDTDVPTDTDVPADTDVTGS